MNQEWSYRKILVLLIAFTVLMGITGHIEHQGDDNLAEMVAAR